MESETSRVRGLPGGLAVKNPPASAGDRGSIPGPGRSHTLLSNEARGPQPLGLCSGVQEPPLPGPHASILRSATREASTVRSQCLATAEQPHSLRLEKSSCTATKTQHSRKLKKKSL